MTHPKTKTAGARRSVRTAQFMQTQNYLLACQGWPITVECPHCGVTGVHETNGDLADPWAACLDCRTSHPMHPED